MTARKPVAAGSSVGNGVPVGSPAALWLTMPWASGDTGAMAGEFPLLVLLGALAIGGFVGGRWLRGQAAGIRRRVLWVFCGLPLAAFGLIPLGGLLGSDTLGWLGGLSLMFMIPLALPLLVGATLGWCLGRRHPAGSAELPLTSRARSPASRPSAAETVARPAAPAARTPPDARRALLLVMLAVGCCFWVLIALGFRLHGQAAPAPLETGLVPAGVLLVALSVWGLRTLWFRRGAVADRPAATPHWPGSERGNDADWKTQRRRWLEAMAADPRRRVYAERIAAGESFWTPDRVEYDLDPEKSTCCEHLAPLERAMRRAGVWVRLDRAGCADAAVSTDEAAVRARWPLPKAVRYEERTAWERSADDPPVARWFCADCQSILCVRSARTDAVVPAFPPAVAGPAPIE